MDFNPFRRRLYDSANRDQAERQRKDADAGRTKKVLQKNEKGPYRGVLQTESELEVVPILQR